jgi:hypothetical protein
MESNVLEFLYEAFMYWRTTLTILILVYMLPTIVVIQLYKAWKRRKFALPSGEQIEGGAQVVCACLTGLWIAFTGFICFYYLATGDY